MFNYFDLIVFCFYLRTFPLLSEDGSNLRFETKFRITSVLFSIRSSLFFASWSSFYRAQMWLKVDPDTAVSCFINLLRVSLRANAHFWYRTNLCGFRKNKKYKSRLRTAPPKQTEWEISPMYYVSRIVLHLYSRRKCTSFSYHWTYINLKEYKSPINVITRVSSRLKNSIKIM